MLYNYMYFGTCLLFSILIFIVFEVKDKIRSKENSLFRVLIYVTLFSITCELSLQILILNIGIDNLVTIAISKVYLVTILLWFNYFSKYVFYLFKPEKAEENYKNKMIQFNKKYNIVSIAHNIFLIISSFLSLFLKIELFYNGVEMYSYGTAVDVMRLCLGIYMTSWVLIAIIKNKKIFKFKFAPIFVVMLLMFLNMCLQMINPSIVIVSFTMTLLDYLLFFTIENPDVKMLQAMEVAKDQAVKANRAKSDFLSSMSHEIRTPLNAIVGFSEDIQNHKGEVPGEVAEDADYILEASKTLLEIVGNILDINKIESNKMEIHNIKYNPREEILTIARINSVRIGEKPIDFKVMIAEDMPYELYGDKIHIKEIVNNLVSNAIKYTDKGEITLKAYSINKDNVSNLIISVTDTGKGIKADKINRLFSKFDRLDVEKNTTTEGTGLGLAITKALTELMGGKINVQSQFGKGSIFMVQIPQTISMLSKPAETTVSATVTEDAVANEFRGKRLLVVDDNQLNIKVARRALKDFDFVIDECSDGLQCLEKVTNGNEYDVILMDIMMPNMNGETTLKHLKENPNFKIPTIALTADAITGAEERYKEAGFDDYIAKPFTKAEIKEKLDKIFKTS